MKTNITGKLMPQAPELEEAVLGAILLESKAYEHVEDILETDDFYVPANQIIYQAVLNLSTRKKQIDMLTVAEETKRMGKLDDCGGPYYIAQLTSKVVSTAHLVQHAYIVKEKAHARNLIRVAGRLMDQAFDPTRDIFEVQEEFEKELTAVCTESNPVEVLTLAEALHSTVRRLEEEQHIQESGGHVTIPTGIPSLDKALKGGWNNSDLNILGGRPSMGKTQFALFFAKVAAEYGKSVLFASLEMATDRVTGRLIIEDERINPEHMNSGKMTPEEWDALDQKIAELHHLPIYIASDPSIRYLNNLRSVARKMKREGLLDFLIIDHVGLIKSGTRYDQRYLELHHITLELKNLAKELYIPILLLTQLKRLPPHIKMLPPTMDDIRESGDIEQNADTITFVHKISYFDPNAKDKDGHSLTYEGQLIVEKQREGQRQVIIPFEHDRRYKKIWEKI